MAHPLVDAAWLKEHAEDADVRIADVRWYLGKPGRGVEEFRRGHIPGAKFVDLDTDLASPKGLGPGRHPLPSRDKFGETLARLGVNSDTIVVAYDDAGGSIAARLWWLLRHYGFEGARVLDGGVQAWTAVGYSLEPSAEAEEAEPHPAARPPSLAGARDDIVDKRRVDQLRADPSAVLLDARARERYEGHVEPIDARAGHIPGAISAPFAENLVAPNGRFKSPRELERRYRELGALERPTVVCYCGSGVTACHDLLALAIVGRDDAKLYEGSWSDWAADPNMPLET